MALAYRQGIFLLPSFFFAIRGVRVIGLSILFLPKKGLSTVNDFDEIGEEV